MSPLSLQDAIAIEGGPLTLGSPPPGIPDRTVGEAAETLNFLVKVFLNNLKDRESGLVIALTRSTGLSCRVRQVEDGAAAILVPAGLVGRLRTLCRTLLRYWDKETHATFLNSPLDRIAEDQWQVPPKLAPLFDHKLSGDQFWTQLQTLDASLDLDPSFEHDVSALMHLGLVFLLAHEFAHVFFRHFEFVAMIQQTKPNEVDRIRRGLELHADSFAGTWATTILKAQTGPKADTKTIARGFRRQSYVVTVILAMFDAHKKYVGFYTRGDYNHPLIRREIFAEAVEAAVSAEGREFYDFWHEVEGEGWKRAVDAFADLNLDAMAGMFGEIDKNKLAYPMQALNYGGWAVVSVLAKLLDEANELLADVKKQVAAFNHVGVSGSAV